MSFFHGLIFVFFVRLCRSTSLIYRPPLLCRSGAKNTPFAPGHSSVGPFYLVDVLREPGFVPFNLCSAKWPATETPVTPTSELVPPFALYDDLVYLFFSVWSMRHRESRMRSSFF